MHAGPPQPREHETFLAYWTAEAGWHTEFELRNNLPDQDLVVTPALRTWEGTEFTLPAVTIRPDEVQTVDVAAVLQAVAPHVLNTPHAYGSAVFRYTSISRGNLYASVMIHRPGYPTGFHLDGVPEQSFAAGAREALWWLPRETTEGHLILANLAGRPALAWAILTDAAGQNAKRVAVALGPRQVRRLSVREVVRDAGFAGQHGGLSIAMQQDAGAVHVAHLLLDETTGFSAIVKAFDHGSYLEEQLWTMRAPMVALSVPDPRLAFPAETRLQPRVFVRNTTADPLAAGFAVNWHAGALTGRYSGGVLSLDPGETRLIDLARLQSDGSIPAEAHWGSLSFRYEGKLGALVAMAASYDDSGRHGSQSPFSPAVAGAWKGSQWHVDGTRNTLATVGNAGEQDAEVAVTLYYEGGRRRYQMPPVVLAPEQQLWLDFGELIRLQQPDEEGRVLPPDLSAGSYEFRQVGREQAGYLYEGKMVIDKTYGHVTYGCGMCCSIDYVHLIPETLNLTAGGSGTFDFIGCGFCGCNQMSGTYGWGTDDTSVAQALGGGLIDAIFPGFTSAFGFANVTAPEYGVCPQEAMQASGPVRVFPKITGPDTVWWFNGLSPSGYATQITLFSSGGPSTQWTVPVGANRISLSTTSGTSTTVTSSGTAFSGSPNDIQIVASLGGMASSPHFLTTRTPSILDNPFNHSFPCQGTGEQGWHHLRHYRVLDNLLDLVSGAGANEGFSGSYVWPPPLITGDIAAGGTFVDDIFVCAPPGSLSPMPLNPQTPPSTTLVDSFTQTWCSGSQSIGPWGSVCSGVLLQTGTLKRYLDHGTVTVP